MYDDIVLVSFSLNDKDAPMYYENMNLDLYGGDAEGECLSMKLDSGVLTVVDLDSNLSEYEGVYEKVASQDMENNPSEEDAYEISAYNALYALYDALYESGVDIDAIEPIEYYGEPQTVLDVELSDFVEAWIFSISDDDYESFYAVTMSGEVYGYDYTNGALVAFG